MARFARMSPAGEDGARTVLEVIEADSIEDRYHPEIAATIISVPAAAVVGSTKTGQQWTHPEAGEPAPPAVVYRKQLSPVEFKMMFTSAERIAIRQARGYAGNDPDQVMAALVIDDFWAIVEDPRLTAVDLALAQTQEGLDFLVPLGILTQERRDEIGLGLALP